ncbi:unnamed protein product [Rotaria sp. Silwood2]|nr:unnamed protein product [Rotaria sp. Silwood2]
MVDTKVECNGEEINDDHSVQAVRFQANSDSLSKSDNQNTKSKEEGTADDSNAIIAVKDTNTTTVQKDTRNNRLITVGGVTGIHDILDPVIEYAAEPLLSLHEACVPLSDILFNLSFYVELALSETPKEPPNGLTVDESAAIRLYTIEWEKPHRSLYSMLNYTLKTAPREELRPYFKYMKLFLTALVKLPCVPPLTVWRGVAKDLSSEFPPGTLVTWWAFSSCTHALPVLENNMYLGSEGERTLFSVEAINGRTVQAHSHFVTEDEILLLPGTRMEVQSLFSPAAGLHIIHLKQIKPTETLLELPFEALLYPPENKKKPWYKKKRTIFELAIIVIICIAGIIVGAVLGSRRPPPPPLCWPRRPNLVMDYFWSFDCGDAREDLTGLYNGTFVNGSKTVSPDFSGQGQALYLDRKQYQYVILPRSLNLTLNTSFTVSAWLLVAGYLRKTILSDCNNFDPTCISFSITDTTINIQLSNWDNASLLQEVSVSVQDYICQSCWIHVAYSFDRQTRLTIFYFNGIEIERRYLNLTYKISPQVNKTKVSYIGLNAVTKTRPFYGLIDSLCILYAVKNASVIRYEATILCQYRFNSDDINAGWGPNNIRARSQHVYRSLWYNQSSLLFNDSDSYFQSSGFTLLHSNAYEYSVAFWLRLKLQKPEKANSAIAVLQLTSSIPALSSDSYTCVMSIHVYQENQTLGYFFPGIFQLVNVSGSFIGNNTWVHIGVAYESPDTYLFYENGKLIARYTHRRFSLVISDDPRFSVTVGGAYLDDSDPNKPDNFEQMKCFARIPAFNYTKMYGEIDDLTFYSRVLNASEFLTLAESHIT